MRKWCSGNWAAGMPDDCAGHLNPVGSIETTDFVPLPADKPINLSPANAAVNLTADRHRAEMGSGLLRADLRHLLRRRSEPAALQGGSESRPVDYSTPKTKKTLALPALQPGTTYYWRIVDQDDGRPDVEGPDLELHDQGHAAAAAAAAARRDDAGHLGEGRPRPGVVGLWSFIADPTAAGGYALWNTDNGKSKISPAARDAGQLLRGDVHRDGGRAVSRVGPPARAGQLHQQRLGERAVQRLGGRVRIAGQPDRDADRRRVRAAGRIVGLDQRLGLGRQRLRQRRPRRLLRDDRLAHGPDPAADRRRGDRSDRPQPGHVRAQRAGRVEERRDDSRQHGERRASGPALPPLPSPWQRGDVGTVAINGTASYDSAATRSR